MKEIYVVGAGPGHPNYILDKAKEIVKASDLVIVGERLQNSFEITGEKLLLDSKFDNTFKEVDKKLKTLEKITFIVSGDPELYSLTNLIKKRFKNKANITVVPGISSVSYFYSKLQRPLNGVAVISLHGRDINLSQLNEFKEVVILLDNKDSLRKLSEYFLHSNSIFILGENLSYLNEKITQGKPKDFLNYKQDSLAILSIINQ